LMLQQCLIGRIARYILQVHHRAFFDKVGKILARLVKQIRI
jgi:hypothetical protein